MCCRPHDLAERLEAAVARQRPGLLERMRAERAERVQGGRSIWERVVGGDGTWPSVDGGQGRTGGFSFGFGGESIGLPKEGKEKGCESGGAELDFAF